MGETLFLDFTLAVFPVPGMSASKGLDRFLKLTRSLILSIISLVLVWIVLLKGIGSVQNALSGRRRILKRRRILGRGAETEVDP